MDIIQVLPDKVANQIAAGEVIQRPASVIKELVENAIDAGADHIDVLVVDAGKTSIQVIDNGSGMSVTDARLAFERHATSKIREADDLFTLRTMGFRGEALPSIASISKVTLTTRTSQDELGTCLTLSGGKFVSQEPVSCNQGSNFLVESIFFNVPARRRFLSSNSTELTNIIQAFECIVLVYPNIHFTLYSNGAVLFNLKPASMHQRIVDVFGKKLNQALLPVEVQTTLCTITGFVGTPESAHKKNVQQYFFVNGRFMKHMYFQKAVQSAYERLVPQGERVPFFIYFTMNPGDIDVNIHPTKTQIKFQDEPSVWQILAAAVKEAVGRFNDIPSIDFDTQGRPDMPIPGDDTPLTSPHIKLNPTYNPFKTTRPSKGWEKLYEGLDDKHPLDTPVTAPQTDFLSQLTVEPEQLGTSGNTGLSGTSGNAGNTGLSGNPGLSGHDLGVTGQGGAAPFADRAQQHYQYKGAYILTSVDEGILVIDQERAHERILYERYLKRMDGHGVASQRLLFAEQLQFNIAEMVHLPEILPEMEALGFEMSSLGGGTYAINAVPAGLEGINVTALVSDMVASAVDSGTTVTSELLSNLAASMARNAAIPHGQALSNDEMEGLVSSLLQCENYRYAPSGRPIMTLLSHQDIIRRL